MITVEVTQEHINMGVRRDECNCAIALALKEKFPKWDVSVEEERSIWVGNNLYQAVDATMVAYWLQNFDDGREVAPFTLELEDFKSDE